MKSSVKSVLTRLPYRPGTAGSTAWRRRSSAVPAVFTAILLLACTAHAQQRDYSALFPKFHALGLPDVTGATYVKLTLYSGGYYNPMGNLHGLRLTGNAWLVKEDKEATSRIVADNCRLVDVWDHKVLNKERQKKMKELMEKHKDDPVARARAMQSFRDDGKKSGQWQKVDLAKDVKKVIGYMEKQNENPRERSWAFSSGGYGTLFLFAVHISKHGHKKEANKIIEMLFKHAGDRRKVILQVINTLADNAYSKAYANFRKNGDWPAFDKELTGLTARFSMGWRTLPAVKLLAAEIKKRIAQTKPPPVTGEGLTEEDRKLAAELATTTKRYRANTVFRAVSGEFWFLSPAEIPKTMKPEDIHVIDRIKARGTKSVPLLLALVKDEYLTEMDLNESRGHGRSSYFRNPYSSSDTALTERHIKQMYNSMVRPASRADIAAQLLQSLPLRDQRGRRHLDPSDREGLHQESREWYDEHGTKTPVQLARLYMEKGDHGQRNSAMQVLMDIGSDDDMAAIEERFLDTQRASSDMWQVRQYVMNRGDKAKAFVDKYEAAMKKNMASTDNQLFKHDGMKKQMEETIKALRDIVNAEPAGKIIEEILAGTRKLTESHAPLQQRLSREKPDDIIKLFLDAALKAKDAKLARDFIGWCNQAPHMERRTRRSYGFVSPLTARPERKKLDPKTHADLWKKLLADDRKVDHEDYYGYSRRGTVADTAAWAVDNLYRDPNDSAAYGRYSVQSHYHLGHRLSNIVRKRATARLEGKTGADIPEFPSADNLTSEDKTNLVTRLLAVPANGIDKAVAALSLDEMLVLITDTSASKKLGPKLAPKAMIVKEITEHPEAGKRLKDCQDMKGKRLTKTMVQKIVDICRDLAGKGKIVNCRIVRLACFDGININLREIEKESDEFKNMIRYSAYSARRGRSTQKGTLSVTVGAAGANAHAVWPLPSAKPAKADTPAKKKDEDDLVFDEIVAELDKEMARTLEQTHKDFWEQLDKYLAGEGNVCLSGTITVFGLPVIEEEPKEKKKKTARIPAGMMTGKQLEIIRSMR